MKNCKNCNKELKGKYQIKFCSHNCSATFNNKKKIKQELPKCIVCNIIVKCKASKFCSSKCQQQYKRNIIFQNIENNKIETSKNCKKYLIKKYGEKCMKCNWAERHPKTNNVPIELNHIDGNSENNLLSNLELLCPNCHSLTLTYKALNKGNGRYKRRERYKNNKSF